MKHILLLSAIVFLANVSYTQKGETFRLCYVGNSYPPEWRTNTTNSQASIANNLFSTSLISPTGLIKIPVVFHILHHPDVPGTSPSVLTEAKIDEQLARLNADMRMENFAELANLPLQWQSLAAITLNFEFVRACIDPQGNTTNGIVIKQTNIRHFPAGQLENLFRAKVDAFGGSAAWPTDSYLNIWICEIDVASGAATFPWQRNEPPFPIPGGGSIDRKLLDGIVLYYNVVGNPSSSPTYNKGRVLTHEVGHWMGLFHTYESDHPNPIPCTPGDFVADTPPQETSTLSCPSVPEITDGCSNASPGIMFMNYMDIAPDDCKYLFTAGQRTRLRGYFTQNGPSGTRYPFIENYFGFKPFAVNPVQVSNNRIVVSFKNPMCLPVLFECQGATLLRSTIHQATLSVPCNSSGEITLTATSGNYFATYTFNYVNNNPCTSWQKKYFWFDFELFPDSNSGHSLVTKGKNGNLFYSIASVSFNHNFNHIGAIPASNSSKFLVHYNSNGTTNWVKDNLTDLGDVFVMGNGNVRTKITTLSPDYIYIDEATGNITTGPNYVPGDEKILAETVAGVYITYKNGQLFVRSPTATTSVSQNVEYVIFNKNTNRLFVQESITDEYPASGVIKIYSLINGSLMPANSNIPSIQGHLLYHVDNNDNVYTLDMRCGGQPLYKFEYSTNTYAPLIIPDFTNINVLTFKTPNHLDEPYTSDVFAVITSNPNGNGRITNVIHIADNTCKQIAGTSNANWSCTAALGWGFNNYIIDGDNIYMAGNIMVHGDFTVVIGPQIITNLPPISFFRTTNYLAKFSIQGDFNRTSQTGIAEKVVTISSKSFEVKLFPNPATNILSVSINQTQLGKTANGTFRVSITDKFGVELLQKTSSQPLVNQQISSLPLGVYFVIVTNERGEKVSKSFIKQ